MKKCLPRCLIVVLAIVAVEALMYINITEGANYRKVLSSKMTTAIAQYKADDLPYLDVSHIMPFNWDRLYIFAPYTSPSEIDRVLGRFWLNSRFTSVQADEDIVLLVFAKNRRVVQFFEYRRGNADFAYVANTKGYASSESRFRIDETGRVIWIGDG